MIKPFKYIYGPLYSWRLGNSLGVDPLSAGQKTCNMNCVYCQLGQTASYTLQRQNYVDVGELMEEIRKIPALFADYITFSGRGEPTLAANLGEMIRAVKNERHEKVAVITNSRLFYDQGVREDLMPADFVLAKLDATNQSMLDSIDGVSGFSFDQLIQGIVDFRRSYTGKLALQIMLLNENYDALAEFGNLAHLLSPDEVQLNTAIRPCAVSALEASRMEKAKKHFEGIPVVTCYDAPVKEVKPFNERLTKERHGNYRKSRYVY